MSKAYICDRCGKVIKNQYEVRKVSIYDEHIRAFDDRRDICPECCEQLKPFMNNDMGDISDGYHTFNELYHHRAILFALVCSYNRDKAWKAKRHHDGTMYDGMFIVGIDTPSGQVTYHYDVDPYWDIFDVDELEFAPKWDGHTPKDAISRLERLICKANQNDQQRSQSIYREESGVTLMKKEM